MARPVQDEITAETLRQSDETIASLTTALRTIIDGVPHVLRDEGLLELATTAADQADAMLAERAKGGA